MSGGWYQCPKSLPVGRIATGLGNAQLLELPIAIGQAECPALVLLDSGATHCFLSEWITKLAGLHLDTSFRLDVYVPDGEQRVCLGVAHKVHITFAPGIV